MDINKLRKEWEYEESIAHIHGWDFSHINDRYTEQDDLPWDYRVLINKYLKNTDRILDIDTGGGEFLTSLDHPRNLMSATEAYPPNVELCKQELLPMGIDFKEAGDFENLPFEDSYFDMVINRHGSFNLEEVKRILKPGGIFITQQVGEDNDWELVKLLNPKAEKSYTGWNLNENLNKLKSSNYEILFSEEVYRPIRFFDIGALVWFARIIEWEFVDFSVSNNFEQLCQAQEILERDGEVSGNIHRFIFIAKKPT